MSKWISVEEDLPPELKNVLVWAIDFSGAPFRKVHLMYRQKHDWGEWNFTELLDPMNTDELSIQVTHWMEIPETPPMEDDIFEEMKKYLPNNEKKTPDNFLFVLNKLKDLMQKRGKNEQVD